jgi:dynein light intermediate chain
MRIDAYRTLYECSITFGIRKLLPVEHRSYAQNQLTSLKKNTKKKKIEDDLATVIATYEMIQRKEIEQRIAVQKIHNDEINYLKKNKQQLEAFIEAYQRKSNIEKIIQEN